VLRLLRAVLGCGLCGFLSQPPVHLPFARQHVLMIDLPLITAALLAVLVAIAQYDGA
jgi:hypothetical protein